eukprot:scaffold379_cov235-Pinguiococcus_pyrenoidosus.AAC.7
MSRERILLLPLIFGACGAFRPLARSLQLRIGPLQAQDGFADEGWPDMPERRGEEPSGGSRFRDMMARAQESARSAELDARMPSEARPVDLAYENFGGVEVRPPSPDGAAAPPPPVRRIRPTKAAAAVKDDPVRVKFPRERGKWAMEAFWGGTTKRT